MVSYRCPSAERGYSAGVYALLRRARDVTSAFRPLIRSCRYSCYGSPQGSSTTSAARVIVCHRESPCPSQKSRAAGDCPSKGHRWLGALREESRPHDGHDTQHQMLPNGRTGLIYALSTSWLLAVFVWDTLPRCESRRSIDLMHGTCGITNPAPTR